MTRATRLASSALVVLSACGGGASDFGPVRDTVRQRVGRNVEWNGERADTEVPQVVHRLLTRPIAAGEAVQIALLRNRDLQARFEELGIARGMLIDASMLPNPSVNGAYRVLSGHHDHYAFGASIDLADAIRMPARRAVAEANAERARARVAAAALDLVYAVRLAFYDYQAAMQTLVMRQTVAEALGAAADTARALHDAGNVTALDQHLQQVAYDEARVALVDAQRLAEVRRERVTALMGLGDGETWTAEERMPDPPESDPSMDDIVARATARSLDLEEARWGAETHARELGVVRLQGLLPTLEVGVDYEVEEQGIPEIGPIARIGLPLFDQGNGRAAIVEAEIRQMRRSYVALAVRIGAGARAARASVARERERATLYHEVILPERGQIVDESLLQYDAMQVSVFQLLVARGQAIDAGARYVDAVRRYWRARAAVDQLVAGRLVDASDLDDGGDPGSPMDAATNTEVR